MQEETTELTASAEIDINMLNSENALLQALACCFWQPCMMQDTGAPRDFNHPGLQDVEKTLSKFHL